MKLYIQWLKVLWLEIGWDAILGIYRGARQLRKGHVVDKLEWRRRMKVCFKCPIYDARYRRCRLGDMGCGCYVPFMALVKKECWMREKYGKAFGWGMRSYRQRMRAVIKGGMIAQSYGSSERKSG